MHNAGLMSSVYRLLADLVLLLHLAVVAFIIGGLLAILTGNLKSKTWPWVNRLRFRVAHLLAIGIVVLQSWLGQVCPLTTLESWLRMQAGQSAYSQGFIQTWVHRLMFYSAPDWVFALIYTLFGSLVLWTWFRFPPER
jgi:hypothetical protein